CVARGALAIGIGVPGRQLVVVIVALGLGSLGAPGRDPLAAVLVVGVPGEPLRAVVIGGLRPGLLAPPLPGPIILLARRGVGPRVRLARDLAALPVVGRLRGGLRPGLLARLPGRPIALVIGLVVCLARDLAALPVVGRLRDRLRPGLLARLPG